MVITTIVPEETVRSRMMMIVPKAERTGFEDRIPVCWTGRTI